MKDIILRDPERIQKFLEALEDAEKQTRKEVPLSRTCREITGKDIPKLFDDNE